MRQYKPTDQSNSSWSKQATLTTSLSQEASPPLTAFLQDFLTSIIASDRCQEEMKLIRIIPDDAKIPHGSHSPQTKKKVSSHRTPNRNPARDTRWGEASAKIYNHRRSSGACKLLPGDSPLILPRRRSLYCESYDEALDQTIHCLDEAIRIVNVRLDQEKL